MERNYETEYRTLVKKTAFGTELRAFFLGYDSEITERYFNENHRKIMDLEHEAHEKKRDIPMTRENLNLEFKLFDLRTKMVYSHMSWNFLEELEKKK